MGAIVIWPEIFDSEDLDGKSNAALCADAMVAWGICMSGGDVHPNFGKVVVAIGGRLGITAIPDRLVEYADGLRQMEVRK